MKRILIIQSIKIENRNFLRAVKITALFLYNLYTYLYFVLIVFSIITKLKNYRGKNYLLKIDEYFSL